MSSITLKYQPVLIGKVWHVQNIESGETIETIFEHKAVDLARRLNIRHMADYASYGEFEWTLTVTGDNYRHAVMPRPFDESDKSLTLCDKSSRGIVSRLSGLDKCPACLSEIDVLNSGFVPWYDLHCSMWNYPFAIERAMKCIERNNRDYAAYLKAEAVS